MMEKAFFRYLMDYELALRILLESSKAFKGKWRVKPWTSWDDCVGCGSVLKRFLLVLNRFTTGSASNTMCLSCSPLTLVGQDNLSSCYHQYLRYCKDQRWQVYSQKVQVLLNFFHESLLVVDVLPLESFTILRELVSWAVRLDKNRAWYTVVDHRGIG